MNENGVPTFESRPSGLRRFAPYGILGVIGLLTSLPLLIAGYPVQSHDGLYHPTWARFFSEQFWNGDLYPRWLVDINGGLGSPVFFMYPPVPFYAAAVLDPVVPPDPLYTTLLGIVCTLVLIASGWACYLWLRRIADGTLGPIIGATFFMIAPYHAGIDLFIRGAYAEFFAFLWMPLILLGLHRAVAGERFGTAGLALAVAGLICTHPPIALIFLPCALAYGLSILPDNNRSSALLRATGGLVWGAGIAAMYWMPALQHRSFVNIGAQSREALQYSSNFLFGALPLDGSFNSHLAWAGLIAFCIAVAALLIGRRSTANNTTSRRRILYALAGIVLVALFMTTAASGFLWDILPLLHTIQFPFRFLSLTTVAAAGLLAMFSWQRTSSADFTPGFIGTMAAALIAATSIPIVAAEIHSVYSTDGEQYGNLYLRNYERLRVGIGAIEYIPSSLKVLGTADDRKFVPLVQRVSGEPNRVRIPREDGTVRLLRNDGREAVIETSSEEGVVVVFYRLHYPGWSAQSDSGTAFVSGTDNLGFMRIVVPPGNRTVKLTMEPLPAEQYGIGISGLSVALLAALPIIGRLRAQRSRSSQTSTNA